MLWFWMTRPTNFIIMNSRGKSMWQRSLARISMYRGRRVPWSLMSIPWSSAEWDVSVVMSVLSVFRQKVVRIESLWIGIMLFEPVNFELRNDDGTSRRHYVVSRRFKWCLPRLIAKFLLPNCTQVHSHSYSPNLTSWLSCRAIAGTGGNNLRVSSITLSRYFISNVSWKVQGLSESLNISFNSSITRF